MAKKVERLQLKHASRVLWGVLAILLVVLVSAFFRAIKTNQALRQELETLQPVVEAAYAQQDMLKSELAYVQSDEYVEKWARVNAAMTKHGEVLVSALNKIDRQAPEMAPESPSETPPPVQQPVPFWLRWWEALTNS